MRRVLMGGLLAAAVAALIVAAVVLLAGGGESDSDARIERAGKVVESVPQRGLTLGRADAPVLIEEFVDVQCPFCAQYAQTVFPSLVERYVKTGRARVQLHLLTDLGADSARGAALVVHAGQRNRAFDVLDALYAHQGKENSGWLQPGLIGQITDTLEIGLLSDRRDAAVAKALKAADARADELKVPGTPSVYVTKNGTTKRMNNLEPARSLEQLIG